VGRAGQPAALAPATEPGWAHLVPDLVGEAMGWSACVPHRSECEAGSFPGQEGLAEECSAEECSARALRRARSASPKRGADSVRGDSAQVSPLWESGAPSPRCPARRPSCLEEHRMCRVHPTTRRYPRSALGPRPSFVPPAKRVHRLRVVPPRCDVFGQILPRKSATGTAPPRNAYVRRTAKNRASERLRPQDSVLLRRGWRTQAEGPRSYDQSR
jgi:hypothetical protein